MPPEETTIAASSVRKHRLRFGGINFERVAERKDATGSRMAETVLQQWSMPDGTKAEIRCRFESCRALSHTAGDCPARRQNDQVSVCETISPLVGLYRPAISNKYLLSGVCHRDLQPILYSGVSPTIRGNTFRQRRAAGQQKRTHNAYN